jgi:DNA-binding winged helix-turn-helix (wHTH) protein
MTLPSPARIRFGLFEVDTRSGELRRNGYKIDLQDQPFQALLLLLEHPGEVVTRDDLHKHLWPQDTFVDFDRGLNKAINKLRYALRDDAEKPRYIETLPQRGYRFIATVEPALPAATEAVELALKPSAVQAPSLPQIREPVEEPITRNQGMRRYLYYGLLTAGFMGVAIAGRFAWTTMHSKGIPPPLATESRLTANSLTSPSRAQ